MTTSESDAQTESSKRIEVVDPPTEKDVTQVQNVPKKLARFSRLPHVKDKVDAFEKLTGKPKCAETAMIHCVIKLQYVSIFCDFYFNLNAQNIVNVIVAILSVIV